MIIGDIEIRNETKYTLLLLDLYLFSRNVFGGGIDRYGCRFSREFKLVPWKKLNLARIHRECRRSPSDKASGTYRDLICGSRPQIAESVGSVIARRRRALVSGEGAVKVDSRAWNDVVVHIGNRAAYCSRVERCPT